MYFLKPVTSRENPVCVNIEATKTMIFFLRHCKKMFHAFGEIILSYIFCNVRSHGQQTHEKFSV